MCLYREVSGDPNFGDILRGQQPQEQELVHSLKTVKEQIKVYSDATPLTFEDKIKTSKIVFKVIHCPVSIPVNSSLFKTCIYFPDLK